MQCSICLDDLDASGPTLACGHRFHASCLARLAGANGTTPTRRGALTACPNCRTTSRVAPMTSAAFSVGDRVLALWGHKWFPGDVYAVKDGGSAYEIAWDDEDSSNEIPASRVRAAPVTVDVDAPAPRHARAAAVVTPPTAPPVLPAPAPRSRFTGVRRNSSRWRASIKVRGSTVTIGDFDDEEDAARAFDAAVARYELAGRTLNFPGEAPLASVLAALPAALPAAPALPPSPAPLSRLRPRKKATYKPTVVRAKKKGSSKTPSRAEEKRKYRQEQKKKKEQKKQANAAKLKAWVGKNDGVELYLQDEGYYQGYVATAWKSTSRRRVAGVEVDARLTTKPCKS